MDAMDADLQESFDWVLGASLDELVAGHSSVAAPAPEVAGSWDLPPGDVPWSQSQLCHVWQRGTETKVA